MPASLFKHDLPQSIEDMLMSLANNDNDGSVTFDKPSYKSAKLRGTLYPFLNSLFDGIFSCLAGSSSIVPTPVIMGINCNFN